MDPLIRIGPHPVGKDSPVFILAEIGSNFDGDFEKAKTLIAMARKCGADAVKFQLFRADEFVHPVHEREMYEAVKRNELPREWVGGLKKYAEGLGLVFLATPFDLEALDLLARLDVSAIKIASSDITYDELLEKAARLGKPLLLSTGMAYLEEVEAAVKIIEARKNRQIVISHCTSSYPTPPEEVRIYGVQELLERFPYPAGFSDHSLGIAAPIAAVALGARLIEKHFTLSRSSKGPDHPHSLEPEEFKRMVDEIRVLEKMLRPKNDKLTSGEIKIRDRSRRGLYARADLKKGEILSSEAVKALRPEKGLGSRGWFEIKGKRLKRAVPSGETLTQECVEGTS